MTLCIPDLSGSDDPAIQTLLNTAQQVTLPEGQVVFHRGSPCQRYIFVSEGRVKVVLTAASGREVILYHVHQGESCVLTTTCLLSGSQYPAQGITETAVTAILFDQTAFDAALSQSAQFRAFVFAGMGQRFSDVIARMEQVNFSDIDCRLAHTLIELMDEHHQIKTTHQQLANEIGTAREVISRHLKQLESRNWIKLHRGMIEVSYPDELARCVETGMPNVTKSLK